MKDIIRLKYVISWFDVARRKPGARRIIDIFPNGEIIVKDYLPGSRRISKKNEYHADLDAINNLVKNIEDCVNAADSTAVYIDDTSAILTIYHDFERVETMPRGLGNDDVRIHDILSSFIYSYI